MKYIHTNLTVENLDRISEFYPKVFGCIPVRSPDDLDGQWVEDITAVKNAAIKYE